MGDERALKDALRGGLLPHELTALALLVGRGGGVKMLPLLVIVNEAHGNDSDGDTAGVDDMATGADADQGSDIVDEDEPNPDQGGDGADAEAKEVANVDTN